jgi:hypothetical protein
LHPKIHKAGAATKVKALFFGQPFSGKTFLLGTANLDERTAPILILDFEGGETTLDGTDADIWTIRSWKDYNEAYDFLAKGKHEYKSVGVDSLSETHMFALLSILEKEASKRDDGDQIQQNDYGRANVQIGRLVREFRDLPYHIFFTAWSKDEKDPKVGLVKVPLLSGQLATTVPGMMEVVGYLGLSQPKGEAPTRGLILSGDAKFRTKVRTKFGVEPPEYIEDPSISKLMDALHYPMPDGTVNESKSTEVPPDVEEGVTSSEDSQPQEETKPEPKPRKIGGKR